jgi:hypothetical protein
MQTKTLQSLGSAVDVAESASFWHVTKQQWMDESGRTHQAEVEEKRRRKNTAYAGALDTLSQTRRRCTDATLFAEYAHAAMQTLATRADELLHIKRVLFRWKCTKTLESFLCRVADRLGDRSSMRFKRHVDTTGSLLSEEERTALRQKLRDQRAWRRTADPRRTVFFGDGTFKCTIRGNPSIPKKKLLKRLAVRTVTVLLDEYRTSKQCPCGRDELMDGPNPNANVGRRVRVHKTDGGVCDLLQQVEDRDEVAVVNMFLATQSASVHTSWPAHLCLGVRLPLKNDKNMLETDR